MRSDSFSYLTSAGATKAAGSNLTCPRDCASGMEGHEATRRQSISSKKARACLPTTCSGAGAKELNPLRHI